MLRRGYHAEVFRTLARDVEGRLSVEQVADDLSALTGTVLDVALQWCWQKFKRRHREQPRLGIIAYGKLGGKELGYGMSTTRSLEPFSCKSFVMIQSPYFAFD